MIGAKGWRALDSRSRRFGVAVGAARRWQARDEADLAPPIWQPKSASTAKWWEDYGWTEQTGRRRLGSPTSCCRRSQKPQRSRGRLRFHMDVAQLNVDHLCKPHLAISHSFAVTGPDRVNFVSPHGYDSSFQGRKPQVSGQGSAPLAADGPSNTPHFSP
jgi:hypothetical protein